MKLDQLIDYFTTATLPELPIRAASYLYIDKDFVAKNIDDARAGKKAAVIRLELFKAYLMNGSLPD